MKYFCTQSCGLMYGGLFGKRKSLVGATAKDQRGEGGAQYRKVESRQLKGGKGMVWLRGENSFVTRLLTSQVRMCVLTGRVSEYKELQRHRRISILP